MKNNKKNILTNCPICKKTKHKIIFNKVRNSGNFTNFQSNENLIKLDIVLCENCGFLFRKDLWSNERQKEYFAKEYKQVYKKKLFKNKTLIKKIKNLKYKENIIYSKKYLNKYNFYKKDFFTHEEARNEIVINILLKYVDLSNKSILDIGCGGGAFIKQVKRFKLSKVVGLEPSLEHFDSNLKYIKDKVLSFYPCTLEDFSKNYADKFDIIVLNGVIKHFNNPLENLKYCFNLLKDDGIIYFSNGIYDPNLLTNIKKLVSIVSQNYLSHQSYLNLFNLSNFKIQYFQKNGYNADFIIKKNIQQIDINLSLHKFKYFILLTKYNINKITPNMIFVLFNILYRIFRKFFNKKINIRYNSFKIIKHDL